jgi:ABC-2 type transport system ATP-binding protein
LEEVIRVDDIGHRYNGVHVLKGVNFNVARGEIFGLLGPNGAGKTTLISILTSQIRSKHGRVSVLGEDPKNGARLRRRIGVAAHELRVSDYLTGEEVMKLHGHFYGVSSKSLEERVKYLLTTVGLYEKRNGLVRTYSEGMRRRLNIALAMIHDPEIVFLDEPTIGLDPYGRRQVWRIVWDLKTKGKTILLTTHYMEEAEFLCDRIALVDRGTIAALGTPAELKARLGPGKIIEIGVECTSALSEELSQAIPEGRIHSQGGLSISTENPETVLPRLLKRFVSDPGYGGARIVVREPSLEDVFLELTGRSLQEHTRISETEEPHHDHNRHFWKPLTNLFHDKTGLAQGESQRALPHET